MATYTGDSNGNTYTGTTSADTISGGFGNDTLIGNDGADLIYGEALIDPHSVQGTETGTTGTMTYINNTTDTLYVYSVNTNGSVTRVASIAPGQTLTHDAPLNSGRVIGNLDGTEYYIAAKAPGVAAGTFTLGQ